MIVLAQSGPEWAVIVPSSVSAVAAAFGAMAAWRAAAASARTSRDAAEALAIALKPSLDILVAIELSAAGETPIASAMNSSTFDAKDVRMDLELDDGKTAHGQAERLKAPSNDPSVPRDILRVVLPVDLPAHKLLNEQLLNRVKVLRVFYSDDRKICRYEQCWRPHVERTSNGWSRSVTITDEKISGPR